MGVRKLPGRAPATAGLLAALLWSCAAAAPVAPVVRPLRAVEVRRHDAELPVTEQVFDLSARASFVHPLELGDTIENQLLILHPRRGAGGEFAVEQRHETSMAVGNEGPHLDLLGWKHYVSPWRELPRAGAHRFLTLKIDEAERLRFPPVTAGEIRAVVLRESGPEWARLVKDVKGPNDAPAYVAVSKVSFRVRARERGRWRVVSTFHFTVPMGC